MQSEETCKPSERYLYADAYWSDEVIKIWQQECIKRFVDKEKDHHYFRFINWQRKENEIALYTLYAYADFPIPKSFNCVFPIEDPENFINVEFRLTQSIWENWVPDSCVSHGHKHLVVLEFQEKVPDIFKLLHCEKEKFSSRPPGHLTLGLCQLSDLDEIIKRHTTVMHLKEEHGDKWWEFDNE